MWNKLPVMLGSTGATIFTCSFVDRCSSLMSVIMITARRITDGYINVMECSEETSSPKVSTCDCD